MADPREDRLYVKPAQGRLVRHPRTFRPIAEHGQDVTNERGYFTRRLIAGDVEQVTAPGVPARRAPKREA
jgi:hypothetical protein